VRYFVTGATGFVGGALVRQLIERGHQVVTAARDPGRAGNLAALGVEVYRGDITDRATLVEPMRRADGVFHVAGWYKLGLRDTSPGYSINVQGTRNVLEVMRDLRIPRGVYTSTLAVFSDTHGRVPDESYRYNGPHLTEYDRTKWLAHYDVAEPMASMDLPLITVLPGLVYGPGDTSLLHQTWMQYLKRRLLVTPRDTAYCWGYVDDIAHAHILAMEKGTSGESYIIAGPAHTVVEALQMAQRITGIPAPRVQVPGALVRGLAQVIKPLRYRVQMPELYSYEGLRSTAGVTYLGSNAKARRELGYDPRPLEEGLPPALEWEMEQLRHTKGRP
jgi:nucleoside-diphosphate-sugar epimerase